MKIIGIIPSRFGSTRFPGKPLIDINGKSMIQRVYEQSKKSKLLDDVIVATDDKRILSHVKEFGGNVIMTSELNQSGTERCAEIVNRYYSSSDVIINIQGDEPFIHPEQIDLLISCFYSKDTKIGTLVKKINNEEELNNMSVVKTMLNSNGEAFYFGRQVIEFPGNCFYKHIGIYGYRSNTLSEIVKLDPSPGEISESLEQLRWIENGYIIKGEVTELESISIDTPEDLEKVLLL